MNIHRPSSALDYLAFVALVLGLAGNRVFAVAFTNTASLASARYVHTGNISYRLGACRKPAEIKDTLKDNKNLAEAFDRMAAHLDANGVDIDKDNLQLGLPLKFDPAKERFMDNAEANGMISRKYREPFVVPEKV